mmetsp:Transcript_7392/g.18956  ORF Transcript_7392/g.18956 Transcript_7392/m.18956 type:complete len:240 (-) Transcript_7392:514-1233(-)
MAAPTAMASSGLMRRASSLSGNIDPRICWTLGILLDPPTRSTWWTSSGLMPPWTLSRARRTGILILCRRSPISPSNSSLDIFASSVSSSKSSSRQTSDSVIRLRSTLSCAHACLSLLSAFFFLSLSLAPARSTPACCLKTDRKCSTRRASMSSPPRRVSPSVARTLKFMLSLSISMTVTSRVPPPKSKTRRFFLPASASWVCVTPKASAAAVGSLMMRFTSSPAILPASLVACLWLSLK